MVRTMSLPGCRDSCYGMKLLALALSLLPCALSTKHNFREWKGPSLIGPVGPPFGFNARGHFELTVYDFELSVKKGHSESLLDEVEPGFFLMRYENEAVFNQHLETLRSNSSLCSFGSFFYNYEFDAHDYRMDDDYIDDYGDATDDLNGDPLTGDDDLFDFQSEITSAEHGIFLSMKSKKNWKPATPSIEYRFKA